MDKLDKSKNEIEINKDKLIKSDDTSITQPDKTEKEKEVELLNTLKGTMLEGIGLLWLSLLSSNNYELVNILDKCINSIPDSDKKILEPQMTDILNVMRFCPLDKIRVVIIGQDPYYNGSAHGIAFSCTSSKIPDSLRQIYKCLLKNKLIKTYPKTANLTKWCEQGILLLNTSLTTIRGTPKKHIDIWEPFTSRLISVIDELRKPMWLLWGKNAHSLSSSIKHGEILKYKHPSPMAGSFDDCPHFTKVTEKYKDITWQL
jgi:uracil-DNA glycosylase